MLVMERVYVGDLLHSGYVRPITTDGMQMTPSAKPHQATDAPTFTLQLRTMEPPVTSHAHVQH